MAARGISEEQILSYKSNCRFYNLYTTCLSVPMDKEGVYNTDFHFPLRFGLSQRNLKKIYIKHGSECKVSYEITLNE